ncbi:MAG: hypothetical protein ABI878_10870 [Acidobacteriota bacterium]
MRRSIWKASCAKALLVNLLGVIAALIVMELALRPFATSKGKLPAPTQNALLNLRNFKEDPGRDIEIRQFQEGASVAHFKSDGSRSTGNDLLENTPTGIIIGDSFVEALQVNDKETMG